MKRSWNENQMDLQGRFDFSWGLSLDTPDSLRVPMSGEHWEPKLLEYNADTPSLQLETGILSEEWEKQKYGSTTVLPQSNYID